MIRPRSMIGLKNKLGSAEIFVPPATHLVATVEDLTDILDYASEEAVDMDEDAMTTCPTPHHP